MLHQFSASTTTFMGARDGAHERRLKEAISVLLDLDTTVARAYLVRASFDGTTFVAVLGLLTHDRKQSGKLALQMDRAFGALFNTEAHLDVVFLDGESEVQIRKACAPFYHCRARYH
ncbi:MAG TPA: hypothetical protein VFL62_13740 [Bradyrhizobium sp.]|uniref:hypothetical protein n=1 Tax=Bradyrhizobium sp. TaxID=376 RepID=UPI002D80BBEF|nr:hypothetical protein [Bradyrhizobium sp.]HET7887285.1 hypothetical protein [Bradyrhizobium sp.]